MSTAVAPVEEDTVLSRKLQRKGPGRTFIVLFVAIAIAGITFIGMRVAHDLQLVHPATAGPFVLLGVALLIALGFEFVNGFHDTANAVATVIYTHSLEPHIAVILSGLLNFAGVMLSSGAVAFGIVSLLPVELILKVSSGAGFAMVFALLVAAIIWNLGTWWLGLPASSSHTMIGSIIGVGLMNQFLSPHSGVKGVDWSAASKVFQALVFSPIVGFTGAFLVLLLAGKLVKDRMLLAAPPKDDTPPPFHIRALIILTSMGVSFAHGSNDGQKGMGLIMLILIGTVPTAYALNHTVGPDQLQDFTAVSEQVIHTLDRYVDPAAPVVIADPRAELEQFVSTKHWTPLTTVALRQMTMQVESEATTFHSLAGVPENQQGNVRNQMYLESETLRLLSTSGLKVNATDAAVLTNYKSYLDRSTKYIPTWVKVAVALALGLGTMVGWRRVVVTVGEKIGKQHLTYAQGATANLVAAGTILAAGSLGAPVSTTHVFSSAIAGTMTANHSGLQWSTIRNIAFTWVFTLPAAALLSGSLYWAFSKL